MELTIQRETLLKALQQVTGIVEKRQALPILSNVLMCINGHNVTLTTTDLEVELISHIVLENAHEHYEVTIPARKLMDICRALPVQQDVSFSFKNQKVTIKTPTAKFTLLTLPAADFPNIDEGPASVECNIPQRELYYLLQRTHFAMAQQDVRYYLNGILLDINADEMRAVATDGHRLAICQYPATVQVSEHQQIIVPRKAILELLRLLKEDDDAVSLALGKNHLRLKVQDMVFTTKLVDGRFPDYNNVLPQGCDKTLCVDKESLKQALSRISILCNDKFKGIRCAMQSGRLHIFASNPEHEEAEEILDVDYEGEELEIGFNVRYLLDVLNAVSGTIRFSLKDANSSVLIQEEANNDTRYVIMPMRL